MAELNVEALHPEYKLDKQRWDMLEDFGEGGRSVIEPGHETGTVNFWRTERDQSGTEEGRALVDERTIWSPESSDSYLFSHERESKERWDDRKRRAQHIPVVQPVLNIYTTGILRSAPQRKGLNKRAEEYMRNVDLYGVSMDEFMFDALYLGLNMGRVHAITDMPRTERQLISLEEQLESGVRPYSYLVRPQDLVDWELDQYGRFVWVKIREEMDLVRPPGVEHPGDIPYAYKIWTRQSWALFEPQFNDKGEQLTGEAAYKKVDGADHNLGVVPLSTFFAKRYNRKSLRSKSLVNSLVDIDRAIFNKMSLLDEIDYGQTFSQLAIPDNSKMGIHGLRTGLYEAFTFDPEGGPPIYLAPDPAMAAGLWMRIVELFHTARVIAGVSRGRAEQSKEERSAAALGQEAEEKHTGMVQHAVTAQGFEESLHAHARLWDRSLPETQLEYNKKFEVRSLEEKLRSALSIQKLAPGPVAMSMVNQAVVGEWLRQCGVKDQDVKKALKDIETYAEEMAAALPMETDDGEEREEGEQGGEDSDS
jgi:hypothetical protein